MLLHFWGDVGAKYIVPSSSQSASELFYISQDCSLKAFAILFQGLVDIDGIPLFDPKVLPWCSSKKVSNIKPSATELKQEVTCRASLDSIYLIPRPNTWNLQCLTDWLNEHPINGEDDVSFIKNTIVARTAASENAAREKANVERMIDGEGCTLDWKVSYAQADWCSHDCDAIKSAFLMRHNLLGGCMAIENRNTIKAHLTTVWQWQMLADKWNGPNFLPVTGVIPDLHFDFAHPMQFSTSL
jgi:hypothetical protein